MPIYLTTTGIRHHLCEWSIGKAIRGLDERRQPSVMRRTSCSVDNNPRRSSEVRVRQKVAGPSRAQWLMKVQCHDSKVVCTSDHSTQQSFGPN